MTGFVAAAAVLSIVVPAVSATGATRPTAAADRVPGSRHAHQQLRRPDDPGCGGAARDRVESVTVKEPKGALGAGLTGVSCKAATCCLVVGAYEGKAGNTHPAAWTWNGTALTPVVAPPMPA